MKRIYILIIAASAIFVSCSNEHEDIIDSSYIEVKASYYSRVLGMDIKDTTIMNRKIIDDIPEGRDVTLMITLTPGASKWESAIISLSQYTDTGVSKNDTLVRRHPNDTTYYMSTTLFSGKGKGLPTEPHKYEFTTERGRKDVLNIYVQDNVWGVTSYTMTIKSKPEYEIVPIPDEEL